MGINDRLKGADDPQQNQRAINPYQSFNSWGNSFTANYCSYNLKKKQRGA